MTDSATLKIKADTTKLRRAIEFAESVIGETERLQRDGAILNYELCFDGTSFFLTFQLPDIEAEAEEQKQCHSCS